MGGIWGKAQWDEVLAFDLELRAACPTVERIEISDLKATLGTFSPNTASHPADFNASSCCSRFWCWVLTRAYPTDLKALLNPPVSEQGASESLTGF